MFINEINHDGAFAKRRTLWFPGRWQLKHLKHRKISEFRERIKIMVPADQEADNSSKPNKFKAFNL
jgi:hypothetical protein